MAAAAAANNTKQTPKVLDAIASISKELIAKLGNSVHFFIKGGAAVPLLLGRPVTEITGDIDTYLMIDPIDSDFNIKRQDSIKICVDVLIKHFDLQLFEYGYSKPENVNSNIAEIKKNESYRGFIKEPARGGSHYQLFIYDTLISGRKSQPLTLLTLRQLQYQGPNSKGADRHIPITLLDIIIPKKEYPLLSYQWNTIESVQIMYTHETSLPVMNITDAYINQAYAAGKSTNNASRLKRAERAVALATKLTANKTKTRKAKRRANIGLLSKKENQVLLDAIIGTLPNNTETIVSGTGASIIPVAHYPPLPPSPQLSPMHQRYAYIEPPPLPVKASYKEDHLGGYIFRKYANGLVNVIDPRTDNSLRYNPKTHNFDPTMRSVRRRY